MCTGQLIGYVILRKHDLTDTGKIFRLILFDPQDLRCCKTGKSNICRIFRQLVFANLVIQIIHLFLCAAIVPEDCRTDNFIVLIQDHQAMHLSAKADSCNLCCVEAVYKFLDSCDHLIIPIIWILLRPSRIWE